jgi:DNA invertase Pin-like site-specific DNA recombinase
MGYSQIKPAQPTTAITIKRELSDRELYILTRQSTTYQAVNNLESMGLQLNDALSWAEGQGFASSSITVRQEGDGKRGVSGTLRIDQRKELQQTLQDIQSAPKGTTAIRVYSISRLFRDKSGAQVGAFIDICSEYDAIVVTADRVYDFNRNPDDIFMFKLLASLAAKENEQKAKLMLEARFRKTQRGEYDGRPLVVGFVVDRDKTSPTYNRFIVYEPHAKVVRRLYARFRELGGQFNLLAAEVASMPVVFSNFEEWVSQLDINKLQLTEVCKVHGQLFHDINGEKRQIKGNHCGFKGDGCKLVGYHISRVGLSHLMVAVEYIGTWKYTLNGGTAMLESNHVAIVDYTDWSYAFKALSHTDLQGLPNTDRSTRAWVPVNKADSRSLLAGILTSPMGSVQNTNGLYRVTELQTGKSQRSCILAVSATLVDLIFHARLMLRLVELHDTGNTDFLSQQLKQTEANNTKALVSVDEQLARYRNEKAGIDAFIKAVGSTASPATLMQYNADLLELEANINALEAKKKTAAAEVSGISELIRRIREVTGSGFQQTEDSRRFIRLATESITLDEYSAHFLTLTVVWRAPFSQVDVCYIYRQAGGRQEWTSDDEQVLREKYAQSDRAVLLELFPTRTWKSIKAWAYDMGLRRSTDVNTSELKNESLSLADYRLLESNGWSIDNNKLAEERLYDFAVDAKHKTYANWLYDIATGLLDTSSRPR